MKWPAQLDAAIGPAQEPLPDNVAVLAAFDAPSTRDSGESSSADDADGRR
jgi:hypothetical protein